MKIIPLWHSSLNVIKRMLCIKSRISIQKRKKKFRFFHYKHHSFRNFTFFSGVFHPENGCYIPANITVSVYRKMLRKVALIGKLRVIPRFYRLVIVWNDCLVFQFIKIYEIENENVNFFLKIFSKNYFCKQWTNMCRK